MKYIVYTQSDFDSNYFKEMINKVDYKISD